MPVMPTTEATAPKAAVAAANVLRRRIVTGEIAVGGSLPPEMQLVEELGLSRPTLRAALRILENEQLITVRRGPRGGASINAPTADVLARRAAALLQFEGATLAEVHEARAAVEPLVAKMVAQRVTPEIVTRLEEAAALEQQAMGDRPSFRTAAIDFHRVLVEVSGNKTLAVFGAVINGIIDAQTRRYHSVTSSRSRGNTEAHADHLQLIELIRDGKAEAAARAWSEHLARSRQRLMGEAGQNAIIDLLP